MVVTDSGQKVVYHVISRTALDGLPFGKVEKDEMVRIIQRYSAIYSVEVFGFAIMGNRKRGRKRGQALFAGHPWPLVK